MDIGGESPSAMQTSLSAVGMRYDSLSQLQEVITGSQSSFFFWLFPLYTTTKSSNVAGTLTDLGTIVITEAASKYSSIFTYIAKKVL